MTSDRFGPSLGYAAAIIMSISALGSSWAGYQASLWGGEQAAAGGKAVQLRTHSAQAYTRAGQQRVIDVGMYMSWLSAYSRGDSLLSNFLQRRFRDEFTPAFEKWVASRPLKNPDAAQTPFALPDYRLALDADAAKWEAAADSAANASSAANQASDAYVLNAVILAIVMFFANASQQAKVVRLKFGFVGIALVICCFGIFRLFVLPRAW